MVKGVAAIGGLIFIVVGLVLGFLWVASTMAGGALQIITTPGKAEDFLVSDATCILLDDSKVVVSMIVAPIEPDPESYTRVDSAGVTGGRLVSAATLPDGAELDDYSAKDLADLFLEHEQTREVDVDEDPRVVVLQFERIAAELIVHDVTFRITYGEPVATQTIPLRVVASESCDVEIGPT